MNIRVKLTRSENAKSHNVSRGAVVSIEFEKYVRHVVASEAYPDWHANALRAQAIASRTYALYYIQAGKSSSYDVVDNTNRQSYWATKEYASTTQATNATAGQVLVYNGRVICAEYASSNGGYSNKAGKPYYRGGYDEFTKRSGRKKNGHERGMSQWGAQQAALEGRSHTYILSYYYPNTSLVGSYNGAGSVATPSATRSKVSNKGLQLVSLARQQVGKPYVKGAAGPNSFDCSGLVKYCYAQFGINLPHGSTSIHRMHKDKVVWTPANPTTKWAAGDIVLTADKSSRELTSSNYTTHVGIATGNGYQVIEAKGRQSGVVISDWSGRSTLHSVIRLFDASETSSVGSGGTDITSLGNVGMEGSDSGLGFTLEELAALLGPDPTPPPIVNVSDIVRGVTDNYKSVIDSIISSKDRLGYVERDFKDNAVVYGYLIDLTNGGEFKFILPDYSISTSSNYESINILGRSSPVKSYESTSERSVTIKVTLAAGTGVYSSSTSDPIAQMESDVQFVKSLLYPDYSKSVLLPPATVLLILGESDRLRGIVTSVDVDYQRPFDSRGRYMVNELSFTVVEVMPYPDDVHDIRSKRISPTIALTPTRIPGGR